MQFRSMLAKDCCNPQYNNATYHWIQIFTFCKKASDEHSIFFADTDYKGIEVQRLYNFPGSLIHTWVRDNRVGSLHEAKDERQVAGGGGGGGTNHLYWPVTASQFEKQMRGY